MNPFRSSAPVEFLYTLYQCSHCGSWLNDKGYVDLDRSGTKIKTTKGKYCKYCRTKVMRDKMDKENAKLFKKGDGN